MAITKLNKLRSKYNTQLKEAKNEFKQKRGLKIARGFKDSPEYKRITKNKKRALKRYDLKSPNKNKKLAQSYDSGRFSDITEVVSAVSYHVALSYGSRLDRAAMNAFKLAKLGDKETEVLFIDNVGLGIGRVRASTEFQFSQIMQEAYQESSDMVLNNPDFDSMSIVVDVIQGDFEGNTYLTVDIYLAPEV